MLSVFLKRIYISFLKNLKIFVKKATFLKKTPILIIFFLKSFILLVINLKFLKRSFSVQLKTNVMLSVF